MAETLIFDIEAEKPKPPYLKPGVWYDAYLTENGVIEMEESAWIKELRQRANRRTTYKNGLLLIKKHEYKVDYRGTKDEIFLNDLFTIQQLQDLINHMKRYQK
jgi:hypothetical protein